MSYILILVALMTFQAVADNAFDEAFDLASKGDVASFAIVAEMFEAGAGVKQDTDKAIYWYTKAATQGKLASRSQYKLGALYLKDLIPDTSSKQRDARILASILRFAVGNYSSAGLGMAGSVTDNLKCRPANPEYLTRAYMWFRISAYNRGEATRATSLSFTMSDTEVEKGRRLAESCIVSDYKNCGSVITATKHKFASNLHNKTTDWKVTECRNLGKLRKKIFISGDSSIVQEISSQGYVSREISTDGKTNTSEKFLPNGNLLSKIKFRLIPESVRTSLNLPKSVLFEKVSESHFKNGFLNKMTHYNSMKKLSSFMPSRTKVPVQSKSRKEKFDSTGRIKERITYKDGRKLYRETFKKDGVVKKKLKYS